MTNQYNEQAAALEFVNVTAAVEELGWRGEIVGPVDFGGARFYAVACPDLDEHARRRRAGLAALVGCREVLAGYLAAPSAPDIPRPAVELQGVLVYEQDIDQAIRRASLLASYSPRAVLAESSTPDLVAAQIDAAVLDQGLVLVDHAHPRLLAAPGPRVADSGLDAREWELLETVYQAWLDKAQRQRTKNTTSARPVDRTSTVLDAGVSKEPGGLSAPLVAALEQAWADIRAQHPELPTVVVILGAGSIGGPKSGLRLGHFASMRWHHGDDRLPEVFIGGEGLARGPLDVLGTLLHEAAHALADVRGIKDTSRQGRWHNARFKALAEEVGIEVTKDSRIGWSPTAVPDRTRELYAPTIRVLGAALRLYRASETPAQPGKSKSPPPCVCACGRRIRVAPSVLETGPITCGICDTEFEPEEQ